MSRSYNNLLEFCEKNNVCEYCFKKECDCYEEVMSNIYFEEQQDIFYYLNR